LHDVHVLFDLRQVERSDMAPAAKIGRLICGEKLQAVEP